LFLQAFFVNERYLLTIAMIASLARLILSASPLMVTSRASLGALGLTKLIEQTILDIDKDIVFGSQFFASSTLAANQQPNLNQLALP
jgi:hypothetical protein